MKSRNKPDHVQRARDAWPLLVRRAETVEPPLTYGQICEPLGVHPKAARFFLKVIQQYCDSTNQPRLYALAVTKKDKLPGTGYKKVASADVSHNIELQRVRQHKWPAKAPF